MREKNRIHIYTPEEITKLLLVAKDPAPTLTILYFLSTGFRYTEGNFLKEHPESFDFKNKCIHYISAKNWDREWMYKDRDIYLSTWDVMNITLFMKTVRELPQDTQAIFRNMQRWSALAGIETDGANVHSLRATRFAWLFTAFPEHEKIIIRSLDYKKSKSVNTLALGDENIDTYKNMHKQFDTRTVNSIKSLIGDWSGQYKLL